MASANVVYASNKRKKDIYLETVHSFEYCCVVEKFSFLWKDSIIKELQIPNSLFTALLPDHFFSNNVCVQFFQRSMYLQVLLRIEGMVVHQDKPETVVW